MSEQMSFDLTAARQLRDTGIRQVAENNDQFIREARRCAKFLCRMNGSVTSDDVREFCQLVPLHPNAWGAIFRTKQFIQTGEFRQSHLTSRKGGMQRVWRLKPQ